MSLRLTRSESGFTYIAALVMVVVMGIMLGATGQLMSTVMKREREKELIFRGLQYRDAIERWTKKGMMPLLDLNHLLKDPRSAAGEKYLRQLYKDPVTGKDFKLIVNQATREITGVASTSEEEPFKKGNFPDVIKNFKDAKKYSAWEFKFEKRPGQVVTAPGTQPGTQQQLSLPLSAPESP